MLYVIRILCSHAFCKSGWCTQTKEKSATFDTENRQLTPDNRHPTTRNQQQPLTATPDKSTVSIRQTDSRQLTTDNYHRKIHPTTETDARQVTFNNPNKKTIPQGKVGSNNSFMLHLSQTWSWQRHNDNVMDSTTTFRRTPFIYRSMTDDRQCRSTYSM